MAKNNRGYNIDYAEKKFIMNYKFAAAAKIYGSDEYIIYRNFLRDFPTFATVVESGRKQKTPRYNKRLTYKNMEKYISTFANSSELMEHFNCVKRKSAPLASPYKYVCDWFKAQFPDYKETTTLEVNNITISITAAPDETQYKHKEPVSAA